MIILLKMSLLTKPEEKREELKNNNIFFQFDAHELLITIYSISIHE